jgi:Cellulose binding domain
MLVVTPQFAAGAGIVIAAMLAVDVPHASLTYGPNPPVRECAEHSCTSKAAPGGLATAKPSIKLKTPRRRPHQAATTGTAGTTGSAASAGATGTGGGSQPTAAIEYRTIRVSDSGFVSMITIKSRRSLDAWTLMFTFSDARVQRVWGAAWQPDSNGHGGVATGQPWPWPGQKPSAARIVIFASGSSARPASCSFNGASCSFS